MENDNKSIDCGKSEKVDESIEDPVVNNNELVNTEIDVSNNEIESSIENNNEIQTNEEIYSSMENMNNENRQKEMDRLDSYAEHVTYNENGLAIYTDPVSNIKYKFSTEENQWVIYEKSETNDDKKDSEKEEENTSSLYENEHYKWDEKQKKWIPKEIEKENDYYKWDDEKQEWIPKIQNNHEGTQYSYDEKNQQHTYKDKDGMTFFWDSEKNAWFPKIDDDFMAYYQMNYGFVDNEENKDDIKTAVEEDIKNDKKEKKVAGVKRKPDPPKWFEMPDEQNSKVYVSNLPYDITEEEFTELMSKYGMIFRDPNTKKIKIKLYRDSNGEIKGDGLVHYIKVESVDLAVNLLDGQMFKNKKLSVERAKFQLRGEYDPSLKPKRKKKDKEKLKKIQEKLFDWRPDKMRGEREKHERVVIIKNLFTPELFDQEVQLIIDYQNDLREECSKYGRVRKVVIYDRHPDGVAQVSMGDAEEADLVVQVINGRFFGQRKLSAELWDGKTRYKIEETETEAKERLNKWDKYLETEENLKNPDEKSIKES